MSHHRNVAIESTSGPDFEEAREGSIIRWVNCTIVDGLLRLGEPGWSLAPSAKAALLWRAYQRYSELVGLKRLGGGLSGSDVLVFRPKLKAPPVANDPDLTTSGPIDVLNGAWGSPLLVKTDRPEKLRQEWTRYNLFLRDRQSPFIAQLEEFLVVHSSESGEDKPLAALIGSFLGGDTLKAEPLDKVIRGCSDLDRCLKLLDQVYGHLDSWHNNVQALSLAQWPRVFQFQHGLPPSDVHPANTSATWLLFGQFNFQKENRDATVTWDQPTWTGAPSPGRQEFSAHLRWEVPFGNTAHLRHHLMGKGDRTDGLLFELLKMNAYYSLTHGDLHPRNVLCDAENIWLIDFEHTGIGPVLADYARMEIMLRLWCIELNEGSSNVGPLAEQLERLLLAHFHGSESSLEPVRQLAAGIGANPDELYKIASCIVQLRTLARRWCLKEFVDGRDYLAVLYLTVLRLLPLSAQPKASMGAGNLRWCMGLFWVLEESLDHILGRTPFDRGQLPYDPLRLISADLLLEEGASGRVHYLCQTSDGRDLLKPVVELQGVLQGNYHHLDAYQHTLSVLAYVEAILADPFKALCHPAWLDEKVSKQMAAAGMPLPPMLSYQSAKPLNCDWLTGDMPTQLQSYLTELFNKASSVEKLRLLLKWCALLHDVGKPGTRTVRQKGETQEVQFIGHEVYGVSLLGRHLSAWFPNSTDRTFLSDLIRYHHTSHQLLGNRLFSDPNLLNGLKQLGHGEPNRDVLKLLDEEIAKVGAELLPLLLLHGYADRLAARGVKQSQPVSEWAEATLAFLNGLRLYPDLTKAAEMKKEREANISNAARQYAAELGQSGRAIGVLKQHLTDQSGTTDELLAWLRAHITLQDLTQLLGEK
ncbi:MAG: HD domain-containing protein [Zavarzinella sp.]